MEAGHSSIARWKEGSCPGEDSGSFQNLGIWRGVALLGTTWCSHQHKPALASSKSKDGVRA